MKKSLAFLFALSLSSTALSHLVALRRVDRWRGYSGVAQAPPQSAPADETMPQLEEVVRACREVWQ